MPKKKQERKQLKKPKIKKVFLIFTLIILIIALLSLSLWLLIETGKIKNPFAEITSKQRLYLIKDECTLIVGQLIHTIKDDSSCEQICKSDCNLRLMNFVNSEFNQKENDCNECNCYCK